MANAIIARRPTSTSTHHISSGQAHDRGRHNQAHDVPRHISTGDWLAAAAVTIDRWNGSTADPCDSTIPSSRYTYFLSHENGVAWSMSLATSKASATSLVMGDESQDQRYTNSTSNDPGEQIQPSFRHSEVAIASTPSSQRSTSLKLRADDRVSGTASQSVDIRCHESSSSQGWKGFVTHPKNSHSARNKFRKYSIPSPELVSLLSGIRYKELLSWQAQQYVPLRASKPARLDDAARSMTRVESVFSPTQDTEHFQFHLCYKEGSATPSTRFGVGKGKCAIVSPVAPVDGPENQGTGFSPGQGGLISGFSHGYSSGTLGSGPRGRGWSRGSGRSPGGNGGGGRRSKDPSPSSPSFPVLDGVTHRGFNCVFCGTDHYSVGNNCSSKKEYISKLRKHHESHQFFYCTDCFQPFGNAEDRDAHSEGGQCWHLCVTEGCPNVNHLKGTDRQQCTHKRNPPRDQWRALFRLARARFGFTHPEGCPDPGNGRDEDAPHEDAATRIPSSPFLQPPTAHRPPSSAGSNASHSTRTSSQLESFPPPQAVHATATGSSASSLALVLSSAAGDLTGMLELMTSLQRSNANLGTADLLFIEQMQTTLKLCRQQLVNSFGNQATQQAHFYHVSEVPQSSAAPGVLPNSEPMGTTSPLELFPPFDYSYYGDVESTTYTGSHFEGSQPGVPILNFDVDMADAARQSNADASLAQGQTNWSGEGSSASSFQSNIGPWC